MPASSARSQSLPPPAPGPLTAGQVAELAGELQVELRRLTPGAVPAGLDTGPGLGERAQTRMLLILDALRRVRDGTYGTCVDCRSPIPYERLAAIPEARSCIRCGWSRHVEQGVRA